ncbi:MAG: molecular chaperone DnaJ [Planctomycetota bacterium]|nr:molecular chaperone DnaJ [Planctomycetota bacterium]
MARTMSNKRDYYEVLGVKKDAPPDEIKKAFRDAAKKWHPDRNPDNKAEAEKRFKEVAEAYSVLSDDEKRKRYDQFGHQGLQGVPGADFSGVSIDDLFASFFGGRGGSGSLFEDLFGGGAGGGGGRYGPAPGASLRFELEITLEEAAQGVAKKIEITRDELCETCSGSGAKAGTRPASCNYCRGTGYVTRSQGFFTMRTTCPRCGGRGSTIEAPCESCKGTGRERKKIRLEVPIPAGVEDNTRVRLAGQGEPGDDNGPRGDLYVIVRVKEHDFFIRRGRDLLVEMPIPYTMAVLGGEIEVPTLENRVKLSVPKSTPSGKLLRLRGLGLPDVSGYGRGDLFVRVVIHTPKKVSKEQEELLRKLAELEQVNGKPTSQSTFFDKLREFFTE